MKNNTVERKHSEKKTEIVRRKQRQLKRKYRDGKNRQ